MVTYSGWQLKVRIGTTLNGVTGSSLNGTSLDGIPKISFDYSNNAHYIGQVGERAYSDIVEGKISISGTIEHFYTGSGLMSIVRGTNETGSMTFYHLGIYPNGEVSGQPFVVLSPIKFTGQRFSATPGSTLQKEVYDLFAIRQYTGSLP
jgi:hypothetical protein